MSPRFRKVALIAASLGLLLSLFLALRPQDDETTAPTSPESPALVRIQLAVRSTEPGLIRRFAVEKGRKVAIVVRSDLLSGQIHLHGYDLEASVAPESPARIQFVADTPGRFKLELEDRGLQIADLEVRP